MSNEIEKNISVIICTKDRPQEVLKCIESILGQSIVPVEIIIVDASQLYNIQEIIKKLFEQKSVEKNIIIKFFRSEANVCKQTNYGIKQSMGNILFILDDDVVLNDDFILEIINVFKRNNKFIGAVMGNIINEKRETIFSYKNIIKFLFFMPKYGNGRFRLSGMATNSTGLKNIKKVEFVARGVTAYDRSIFNRFMFDENLFSKYSAVNDVDFSYRICKKFNNYYTPLAKCIHYEISDKEMSSMQKRSIYIQGYSNFFNKNIPKTFIRKMAFRIAAFGIENRVDQLPLSQIVALILESLIGKKRTDLIRRYYRKSKKLKLTFTK